MPFSSDGETIDFIYGVINWKCIGDSDGEAAVELPSTTVEEPVALEALNGSPDVGQADEPEPLELTDEHAPLELTDEQEALDLTEEHQPLELIDELPEESLETVEPLPAEGPAYEQYAQGEPAHFSWEDGPLADVDAGELPHVEIDENAGLADRLWAARETAEAVKAGEGRTRSALYRALALAYDFALAAGDNPEDYAELLEESGVKAQARAPMTPIVKLVFGIDYDKARLTEFAAALSYALRSEVALGGFQDLIEKQPGGLKALVAAERQARRPETRGDTKSEVARARLRSAPTISLADVPAAEEFALVVTRRGPDGRHEAVAIVDDEALIERAIRRTA
jgi:hypothetical protein